MLATAIRNTLGIKATYGPLDDFWYRPIGTQTAAGVTVGDTEALAVPVFWACVRVLSDTVGAMPWHTYRREGEGDDQQDIKAKDYEWYNTLHRQPNVWQDAMTWKAMAVGHLCLRGNFYCRVVDASPFWPTPQLLPLHPDRVEIIQEIEGGSLTYAHKRKDGQEQRLRQDEVLHVKLIALDGYKGLSPLAYAKATLGLGLAQTKHASSIYGGGGFFKYFLKTTKRLGKEGRENFRKSWRDIHGDPSSFTPPILEDDMDIKTLGMSLEDSQLLESRKFGAYEICQFLGVPPHLVFLLDRATFSNIEQQSIEFVTIHLNPWLVRFEQAIQPQFDEGYFSEFARDSIVRGDIQARYDAYSKALQGRPFMTPNDVRRLENMPPVEGWDEPIDPLNMAAPGPRGQQATQQSAEEANEQDEQAAAFDLAPLIAAASQRIVAREVNGLRARVSKAVENRELYNAWAAEWFARHVEFVRQTVEPVFAAASHAFPQSGPDEYCQRSLEELRAADSVRALLDDWSKTKAERLTQILGDAICMNL